MSIRYDLLQKAKKKKKKKMKERKKKSECSQRTYKFGDNSEIIFSNSPFLSLYTTICFVDFLGRSGLQDESLQVTLLNYSKVL